MSVFFRAHSWRLEDNVIVVDGMSSAGKKVNIRTRYYPSLFIRLTELDVNKIQVYLSSLIPVHNIYVFTDKFIKLPLPENSEFIPRYHKKHLVAISVDNMHLFNRLKTLVADIRNLEVVSNKSVSHLTRFFILNGISPGKGLVASSTTNRKESTDEILCLNAREIRTDLSCVEKPKMEVNSCYLVSSRKGYFCDNRFFTTKEDVRDFTSKYSFCVMDSFDSSEIPFLENGIEVNKLMSFTRTSWDSNRSFKGKDEEDLMRLNREYLESKQIKSLLCDLLDYFCISISQLNTLSLPEMIDNFSLFHGMYQKETVFKIPEFTKPYEGQVHCTRARGIINRCILDNESNRRAADLIKKYPGKNNIAAAFWSSGYCKINQNTLWNILEDIVIPSDDLNKREMKKPFTQGQFHSMRYKSQRDRILALDREILFFNEDILITRNPTEFSKSVRANITDEMVHFPDGEIRSMGWKFVLNPLMDKTSKVLKCILNKNSLKRMEYALNRNKSISVKDKIAFHLKSLGYNPKHEFISVEYVMDKSNLGVKVLSVDNIKVNENNPDDIDLTLYYNYDL